MGLRSIPGFLLLAGLLAAGACAPAEKAGEESAEASEEAPTPATEAALPEADADAVWTYLTEADYHTWATWPGKGEKYAGTEPHGALLTTYVNAAALDAINNAAGGMPAGAIIVKENFMPDSTLAATTVMYKIEGYDPEHSDWWWMKRMADGSVAAQGQVATCQGCHGGKADNDYIMTAALK
ncbi:MAG: cytochrome P460 family protein [Gemmatimonadota bacterium]